MLKIATPDIDTEICIRVNTLKKTFSFSDENIIMGSINDTKFKIKEFWIKCVIEHEHHYEVCFDDYKQYENLTLDIPKNSPWIKVSNDEFEIVERIWVFNVPDDSHIKKPMDLLGYTIKDSSDYSSLGQLST
jgi:hypothetical protein